EKVDAHCRIINLFQQRLPESTLILETGAFDTQKLQDPSIQGVGYQKGVQYGYANVKQYVLYRDQHHCQAGRGGCSKKLQVHHIIFRSEGGSDAPDNLITLCDKHHEALHDGKLPLEVKKHKSLKSETLMGTVRKRLLSHYPEARETFGYITKVNRHLFGIEKSHAGDAFVIGGGDNSVKRDSTQYWAFKRKNSRSLQKNRKGFDRSIRRQRYPLQPKDLVRFEGAVFEVKGMQNKGNYVKLSNGKVIATKKVALIFHRRSLHPTHTP
ncbi:MAG TPA: HNH endonuclease, partial [Chitinophagaceae bacterium]|nr:HNH endonuclease [Chitinophagaceae bacterium]